MKNCIVGYLCFRGKEFRTDFNKLAAVRAYYPELLCLALTATASDATIKHIKDSLQMKDPKIIKASPNRANIYISKERRSGILGDLGYEEILAPIAYQLKKDREFYPLTLIYFSKIRSVFFDLKMHMINSKALLVSCQINHQYSSPTPP